MSRSDVRLGPDGKSFFLLRGSTGDRYQHLNNNAANKQPKNCQQRVEHYCLLFALFLAIASIAICARLFYFITTKQVQIADDFCVPCDKLKFSPFPNENEKYRRLKKDYENDVKVCCASTPHTTDALLDLISERKLKDTRKKELHSPIRDGYFKGSQISAHVLLSGYNDKDTDTEKTLKLLTHRKLSHLNGVNVTNDRLMIYTKGKYFLYSQMYYKVILGVNEEKSEDIISHKIMRYNLKLPNSHTEVLLNSKFTFQLKEDKIDDHDFSTIFISGIFELEKNDELYITLKNANFLSRIPEHNFIGLFLLG